MHRNSDSSMNLFTLIINFKKSVVLREDFSGKSSKYVFGPLKCDAKAKRGRLRRKAELT